MQSYACQKSLLYIYIVENIGFYILVRKESYMRECKQIHQLILTHSFSTVYYSDCDAKYNMSVSRGDVRLRRLNCSLVQIRR